MGGSSGQFGQVALGHALLAGCAVLYLAWWWIFFRPTTTSPAGALRAVGVAYIGGAAALGIGSVTVTLSALGGLPSTRPTLPGAAIGVAGIAAYIALMFVTSGPLHRPVTTELILIVGWPTMEVAVLAALWGTANVPAGALAVLGVLVAVAFVSSLVCYVLYYSLAPWPSFVDGMIPLGSVGVISAVEAVVLMCQSV